MTTLPAPIPQVPVDSLDDALHYYHEALGFTVDWHDDALGLAGVSRGACRLFLATVAYQHATQLSEEAPLEREATALTLWINLGSIDEVNELYTEWYARGAAVLAPPESKPYGLHEFSAVDADGNRLRVFYDFATPNEEKAR